MTNRKSQFLNKMFLLFALAGFLLIFNQEKLDDVASFLLPAGIVLIYGLIVKSSSRGFNIYTRKYKTAEKYLRTASRISPRKTRGRFYYGVSRYLNGNTTDGIQLMNKAVGDLPTNMRKRPVDSLKNIISSEFDRKGLIGHFDEQSLQFKMDETRARKSKTATQIRYSSKQKMEDMSGKSSMPKTNNVDSTEHRGTWERLVRVRPGPVLLEPYKIGGSPIVNRAGKSYRKVLDEKVEEWKRRT